jgi:hypothetical protein
MSANEDKIVAVAYFIGEGLRLSVDAKGNFARGVSRIKGPC